MEQIIRSDSQFKMANVSDKVVTHRRAVATGRITMAKETALLVKEKKLPKGDALAMAEMAGLMGVKKTTEILPLCHPLPIESVQISCAPDETGVQVSCEVITNYKTGVEMEALMGVNAALLCIYDLVKPVDPQLCLEGMRLVLKEGGKSGNLNSTVACRPEKKLSGLKGAVLVISDSCYRKEAEDISGNLLKKLLTEKDALITGVDIVPDEIKSIQEAFKKLLTQEYDFVVSTGGTGFSSRDVTVEAVEPLLTKKADGFGELFRQESARKAPMTYLSRCFAGFIKDTLIICLPGNPNACRDGVEILSYLLPGAIRIAKGRNYP